MSKYIHDKTYLYGIGGWSYKFPCLVGKTHLARLLKREAVKLRLDAVKMEANASPDAASWVGPLSMDLAADLRKRAVALDRDAEWAAYGSLEAACYEVPTFEADMLHRRAFVTLADEVGNWTLQNIDCYPRVRLWLEFAELLYAVNINDVFEMLSTRHPWEHPSTEMIERFVNA